MDAYTIEREFLDITETGGLTANQTKTYDSSGSGMMTADTIGTSSTSNTLGREIEYIEIYPPEDVNGLPLDLREVWFTLDSEPYRHYIDLSGYAPLLMTPPGSSIEGGRRFRINFGIPLWKAFQMGKKLGGLMPLVCTCPKFTRDMTLSVSSKYGVTVSNGFGKYRARVVGYQYEDAELKMMAKYWNNSYSVNTWHRALRGMPALSGKATPSGPLSLATFGSYPGGTKQGSTKINPYWHFAYLNADTEVQNALVLSNFTDVGGAQGNVENEYQDLGLPFALNNNGLWLRGWGVKGVQLPTGQTGAPGVPGQNLARAGWRISGTDIPEQTGGSAGIYMTQGVQPLSWGKLPDGTYRPIPAIPGEPMVIQGQNAAPFIGANGSAIAADTVAVVLNGTLVEIGG